MIDHDHRLPITRQAELLGISRASVYYVPRPTLNSDLALMRRIDALHLEHPFMGARQLPDMLRREGFTVARRRVATLMRKMGVEPLCRRTNTSRKHPAHPAYPYLLRGRAIDRPNEVGRWTSRTCQWPRVSCTCAPCSTRPAAFVLAHRISISLDEISVPRPWRRRSALRTSGDREYGPGRPVDQPRLH